MSTQSIPMGFKSNYLLPKLLFLLINVVDILHDTKNMFYKDNNLHGKRKLMSIFGNGNRPLGYGCQRCK